MYKNWMLLLAAALGVVVCLGGCSGGQTDQAQEVLDLADSVDAPEAYVPGDTDAGSDIEPADVPTYCPPEFQPCTNCKDDSDCAGVFPGLDACQKAACEKEKGYCTFGPVAAGTSCDDGDLCNGEETCKEDGDAMVCSAGVPPACDDGDLCNGTETCDAATGCVDGQPLSCDDGDVCNGVETCDAATGCVDGQPLFCDDGDVCNGVETCDPATGCEDGAPEDCDDQDDCTADACDAKLGCSHLPNGNPGCCEVDADCDDLNPCTTDTCEQTDKACQNDPAVAPCDDGDPCTQGDACADKQCVPGPALPGCSVLCNLAGAKGDIVQCDVGLARRFEAELPAASAWFSVQYGGAWLLTLVDHACFPEGDCLSFNIPESGTTLFEAGHTVMLTPDSPSQWGGDLLVQIEHMLDPAAAISSAYYDDLEMLHGDAHLLGLTFELTADVPADAGIPVLLYGAGAQGFDDAAVDLAVTTVAGTIVTAQDACGKTTYHCFDALPCTADQCDDQAGKCSFAAQSGPCDDGNPCTAKEQCDNSGLCVAVVDADQGTACTGDDKCGEVGLCDGQGTCLVDPDLSVQCPAAPSDCAAYQCDPKSGKCGLLPAAAGLPCDDQQACTFDDACDGLGGCAGKPLDCDDGFACTADSCDAAGQCVYAPQDSECDDGNDCTKDTCVVGAGCQHASLDGPACDDADSCTLSDKCVKGKCTGSWNAAACGCTVTADCADLEDGNLCNGTYVCKNGSCIINPSTLVTCPTYANDCNDWVCNPATGKCEGKDSKAGTPCGDACLLAGQCTAGGVCSGATLSCDDGNDCTTDSCDPLLGCLNTVNPGCVPKLCVCKISGAAGSEAQCPLLLVRQSQDVSAAAGADFELQWDPAKVTLKSFEDQVCMGPVCLPKKIPTCQAGGTNCSWGSLYPTGHNIVAVPKDLVEWKDHGTLLFFHPTDPFQALASAFLTGEGAVSGDPQYLLSRFTLVGTIGADAPVCLWMKDPHFSLSNGLSLGVKAEQTAAGLAVVVY